MLKSRKGNIPIDIILIMIVMTFIISLFVVVADKLNSDFRDSVPDDFDTLGILNETEDALGLFNTGVPFIFFGFMIAALTLAWFLRSNPVFLVILIMVIAVVAIVAAAISNTWFEVARDDSLVASSNKFPYMVFINENLPLFLITLGMIILIFMFAKPKSGSFQI